MNTRTLCPLVRPTAHAIKWPQLAIAAGLGLVLVLVPAALISKLASAQLIDLLRIAGACAALGLTFVLDDPSTRSTPSVPATRLARNLIRAAIAMLAAAIWWTVLLIITTALAHQPAAGSLHPAAATLEVAALLGTGLALAAIVQRGNTDGNIGVIGAPILLLLVAALWFLPNRIALILAPDDPRWASVHHRWAGVLIAALIAFLWASREPNPRRGPTGRSNRGVHRA